MSLFARDDDSSYQLKESHGKCWRSKAILGLRILLLFCSLLKKDRYFTKQTERQGPKSKAFTKFENVKSEEGNENLG